MGRKSLKEIRQLEIIKVFYKVAKKEGLENTSIAKIAAVMEINPSLIIHYFKTKDELTYALIDYTLEKYLTIYRAEKGTNPPSADTLAVVIDDLFSRKWNKLFDDGLFYSCYALTFREKKVKEMYRKLTDSLRLRLTALIQRCNDAGLIEVDNPRLTADLIFALVDGAYFYLSVSANAKAFDEKIKDYKAEAYRLLGIPDVIFSS
ncbi:transcriptional regulator, TetR family [Parapedobacter luteus]|uniref:Biofilm operon icaADBC HTH-type negative transcriptional regulator IcaR n=1 Tax=Parapedobacter luteus TaxID=623280 RepID=A0A1T4ZZU5_9SPHI|nr:TetR family transcriptional regulator [Parapedobacter luteus]SKB28029.1 transcriptional regulator, TetR family [Parapedobacter luteus]